jgi:hypothetical protein
VIDEILEELRAAGAGGGDLSAALRGPVRVVHLGSRWEGRLNCILFSPHKRDPLLVIKVDHHQVHRRRLLNEWETLNELARWPAMDGRVPAPVALVSTDPRTVLAQAVVPGVPLSRLRRRGRRTAASDHAQVTQWLTLLHSTAHARESALVDPDQMVDRVDQMLPQDVGSRARFLGDVAAQSAQLGQLSVPLLPRHGDMGPSNLLRAGGQINVIDWENARRATTPLTDLVVFLTLYARALSRPGVALDAIFGDVFCSDGWLSRSSVRTYIGELRRHGLPLEAAEPLLVSTLSDLASGATASGLSTRARGGWRNVLAFYATHGHQGPLRRLVRDPRD